MTRDYSDFFPSAPAKQDGTRHISPLQKLGWQPHFAQQIGTDELERTPPVRIVEQHRSGVHVMGDGIDTTLPPIPDATVGDWLLYDAVRPASSRRLIRKSLIKRRAPGTGRQIQLVAANIDTIFVVSSCNADFNIARLERYLALAFEAEIDPVIVLTKADTASDWREYAEAAAAVSDTVPVVTLDARGHAPKEKLAAWCGPGHTVAFLGSSGVGKSTLTNALVGSTSIATQGIREDDAKGRHTTTRRQLHMIPGGALVLDTPGMRELQVTDAATGIGTLFADLEELATRCRFNDCQHETEPGCAIQDALSAGIIDQARMQRWQKLQAEDAFNTATLAERKSRDKALGKTIRQIQKLKGQRH